MFEIIKETDTDTSEQYTRQKLIRVDEKYLLIFDSDEHKVKELFSNCAKPIRIDRNKYVFITNNFSLAEEKYHFLLFDLERFIIIDFDIEQENIVTFQGIGNIMKYKKIPPDLKFKDDGNISVNIDGEAKDLFIYKKDYYFYSEHAYLER